MNAPLTFSAKTRPLSQSRGFALIATISIMVLLALIAVGLLSLSSVTIRTAQRGSTQKIAEANARLSLFMAIAELQRLVGPDQRITSSANILSDPDSSGSSNSRPHLTGVWQGWKWDGEGNPNYDSHKEDDFLGWLQSHPDREYLNDPSFADSAPTEDAIRLVGDGSVPDFHDHVYAEQVPIIGANATGAYAWVVLDQGQKACLTLPESEAKNLGRDLAELTSPSAPGFQSVQSNGRDWAPLKAAGNDRLKLISHGQVPLTGINRRAPSFHDLTPYSTGLAVNAAEGGFSRDLSLLFDQPTLPEEYRRRFLYSDSGRPLNMPPARFKGSQVMPAPDPTWSLLHSHARLHTKVQNIASTPTIGTSVTERPRPGTPSSRAIFHRSFMQQQLAPVIAKAQFIFSIGFGASVRQGHGQVERGAAKGEDWVAWLVTDPVITLWNPYDVNLSFKEARVDLHRVPLAFHVYRNGRTVGPDPTLFANSYLPGDFANRKQKYYRLNIGPAIGEDGEVEDEIVLKPGEHRVFTAHNHMPHYQQRYMKEGVDLRPGWNAPAGASSSPYVGGFSSLNLNVDSAGNPTGRLNKGVISRLIPVKAGDRIKVAVSHANADIDKFGETNQQEITAFLKYYVASHGSRRASEPDLVGGIELDYGEDEKELLPSYSLRDMPEIRVPRGLSMIQGDSSRVPPPPNCRSKEPFLIASLNLKTEHDSREPARSWLHNAPTNLYSTAGLDQTEDRSHHQYEFSWEPMTDWDSSPTVEIDPEDRGFGASGIYAQTGQEFAPFAGIPLAPLTSMAQLRHAPLNSGGQQPLQAQVVANSFPHPLLEADRIKSAVGDRTFYDHSFMANQALFDSYFFSSMGTQDENVFDKSRTSKEVLTEFLSGESRLPNPRMRAFTNGEHPEALAERIVESETGYLSSAATVGIEGAFNVNSTSVAAWQAVLASLQPEKPRRINVETGALGQTGGVGTLVSRQVPPLDEQLDGMTDPAQSEKVTWRGHRRLNDYQIEALAEEIVEQVKARGPFQSLAEFVNRRAEGGKNGESGALQAAIDASGINDAPLAAAPLIVADPTAAFPEASKGTSADGAPTVINQADFLTPLASIISVRSDTFVIRGYGEAGTGTDKVSVWCEATVQREPAYINPDTTPETHPDTLDPADPNARFGRRFNVVAFRWLSRDEV